MRGNDAKAEQPRAGGDAKVEESIEGRDA